MISASQLEPQDTEASSTLQLGDSAESVTAARDLFKVVKTAMGAEFMLVGIEHQDKIHYAMPVRVMNLDAYAYNKQWKLLKEKYKHGKPRGIEHTRGDQTVRGELSNASCRSGG